MQTSGSTNPDDIGLRTFEKADREARNAEQPMPDILVFDTDSKRMGEFGGFFLAEDCGATRYLVPDAPQDPGSRERVNGPKNRVPGVHLPGRVNFALVAAGPLFTVKEQGEGGVKEVFHFEAIAFVREVIDRRTKGFALLKLTTRGPAAVKLHRHMTADVSDPIHRMNEHYHGLAKKLFAAKMISKERYDHIMSQEATPQMFWMPVDIRRGVQIGRDSQKSVVGAMVYTDEPDGPKKFKSRWPQVETGLLVTPDEQGGLLLTGAVQKFCQENRARYERALAARAAYKGRVREQGTEPATTPGLQPQRGQPDPVTAKATRAAAKAEPEDNHARLLREVRSGLRAVGKSERDPDVIRRMEEFGSGNLPAMSEVQLDAFNTYVGRFARRLSAKQKKVSRTSPAS